MKKTEFSLLIGLIIAVILTSITSFAKDASSIRNDVLRLHILANSDSETDQSIKLAVRDAILENSNDLFDGSKELSDAIICAKKNLERIEEIANKKLESLGAEYRANAEVCNMYFETREYENFTLPAGEYNAVRITLGKAEGKNFWCVLFPSLCIPAAQDDKKIQQVLSESEIDAITSPKYKPKFAIIEFFESLKKS